MGKATAKTATHTTMKTSRGATKIIPAGRSVDHERLLETAIEAIDDIFSNTSVTALTTVESLERIQEEVELKLSALRGDIRRSEDRASGPVKRSR